MKITEIIDTITYDEDTYEYFEIKRHDVFQDDWYESDEIRGRDEEIQFFHQLVIRSPFRKRPCYVFLHGPHGTGKTYVVRSYMRQYEQNPNARVRLWYVNLGTESPSKVINKIKMELPHTEAQDGQITFNQNARRDGIVLIFDDCEKVSAISYYIKTIFKKIKHNPVTFVIIANTRTICGRYYSYLYPTLATSFNTPTIVPLNGEKELLEDSSCMAVVTHPSHDAYILHFQPYEFSVLASLVKLRIEKALNNTEIVQTRYLDKNVVSYFVGKLLSFVEHNARMIIKEFEQFFMTFENKRLSEDFLITSDDVDTYFQSNFSLLARQIEKLKKLTPQMKLLFHTFQTLGGLENFSQKEIFEHYTTDAENFQCEPYKYGAFYKCIKQLEDLQLLTVELGAGELSMENKITTRFNIDHIDDVPELHLSAWRDEL